MKVKRVNPKSSRHKEKFFPFNFTMGFPGGSVGKESTCNAGGLGLIPGLGRSPGGGHSNPLQYSCLENPHGQRSLEDCSFSLLYYEMTDKFHWEKKESEVAQSCPTLCDPMDCSLPGSSVHGIFQARILKWVAISFSRRSFRPRDRTRVSRIVGRSFTLWATRKSQVIESLGNLPKATQLR